MTDSQDVIKALKKTICHNCLDRGKCRCNLTTLVKCIYGAGGLLDFAGRYYEKGDLNA